MPSYFCSLKEWTTSELAATGSLIGKSTVEPAAPSEESVVKANAIGKKNVGVFNVPTLAGGEVVIAATLHVYSKVAVEGKSLKVAFVSPAVAGEPNVKVASSWLTTVSLSKAQSEALTQATLNTLACQLEIILAKSTSIYEVYLALETEVAGGSPVNLSGTIAVKVGSSGLATDRVNLGGTVAVRTGASSALASKLGFGGTVVVKMGGSGSVVGRVGLGGMLTVRIASSASVRDKVGLSGTIRLVTGAVGNVTTATGQHSGSRVVYVTVDAGEAIPLTLRAPAPYSCVVSLPLAYSLKVTTQSPF
jgi:hypothetical protein